MPCHRDNFHHPSKQHQTRPTRNFQPRQEQEARLLIPQRRLLWIRDGCQTLNNSNNSQWNFIHLGFWQEHMRVIMVLIMMYRILPMMRMMVMTALYQTATMILFRIRISIMTILIRVLRPSLPKSSISHSMHRKKGIVIGVQPWRVHTCPRHHQPQPTRSIRLHRKATVRPRLSSSRIIMTLCRKANPQNQSKTIAVTINWQHPMLLFYWIHPRTKTEVIPIKVKIATPKTNDPDQSMKLDAIRPMMKWPRYSSR